MAFLIQCDNPDCTTQALQNDDQATVTWLTLVAPPVEQKIACSVLCAHAVLDLINGERDAAIDMARQQAEAMGNLGLTSPSQR